PEGGRLLLEVLDDHHPFQLGERSDRFSRVRTVADRVHPEAEKTLHLPPEHMVEDGGPAPVPVAARRRLWELRMKLITEVVLLRGGTTVIGLELADRELVRIG